MHGENIIESFDRTLNSLSHSAQNTTSAPHLTKSTSSYHPKNKTVEPAHADPIHSQEDPSTISPPTSKPQDLRKLKKSDPKLVKLHSPP